MSTINNAAALNTNFQPRPATGGIIKSQVGSIGKINTDQLHIGPAIDPILIFKPTLKSLELNVLKAAGHRMVAEEKVEQAQQAAENARTPIEKFMARRELDAATKDLDAARLELAKAQLAVAERRAEDADDGVANAEKALMAAGNPFTKALAMRQLEAAVKTQTKAHEQVEKAQGELQALETRLFPIDSYPPVIIERPPFHRAL